MRKIILISSLLFIVLSCTNNNVQKELGISYLNGGKIIEEKIPLDFINEKGEIISPYIDSVYFSYVDSLVFKDGQPDNYTLHSTPYQLDFTKEIKFQSPEYYTAYSVYNIIKVINYYNKLFDNKIDFNSQKEYLNLKVSLGDVPFFTTPAYYIFEEKSYPSPSVFYHEIGHRAFWYMEDSLDIKFKGLSYIHMGLLEYFTVSLNNSPFVGEDALPAKMVRDASVVWQYPPHDTLRMWYSIKTLKESYPEKIADPNTNIARYYNSFVAMADDEMMQYFDNHREGMLIASTLWRIRQIVGQEKTDRLIAQTILNLNEYMNERDNFLPDEMKESARSRIDWFDLYYGLVEKDKELYNGENKAILEAEFKKTGFLVNNLINI